MTQGEIPADIRRFILGNIPSVPYLEAVLLLRAEPDHGWDTALLARRLYVGERTAADLLQSLAAAGIAVTGPGTQGARYGPAPDLRAMLDQVADAYASDLVAVTALIHSRIDKRAQQFADAFRFRKE